jgi:spore maturation protein CgeB
VFEAAGAGACIITDHWEGIEMFLEPNREILVACNGEDVVRIMRELTHTRARQIGAASKHRVLAEHTYAHRAARAASLFYCRLSKLIKSKVTA